MSIFNLFARSKKPLPKVPRRIFGSPGIDETIPGLPDLEFMDELAPPEGLKVFWKMEVNEPIIGGLMLNLRGVMKRVSVDFDDGDKLDFFKATFSNLPGGIVTLIDNIASAFTFGFYLGEMVWTIEDGMTVLKDIIPLFQPSIHAINDDKGNVRQVTAYSTAEIPYTKCVHQTFISEGRSPYGRSLLRHLYKPYYYKISCEAAEATGIDRDLSGLPVLTAPEVLDFTAADPDSPHYDPTIAATLDWAVDVVSNVRKDNQQGLVLPAGWQFSLVRGDGTSSIDTTNVIQRYNTEMAAGLLESFLVASGNSVSSKGNMETLVKSFLNACDAYVMTIEETINSQIINKIALYNGIENPPHLRFSTTDIANLKDLGSFVARLVNMGVITPTTTMEKALLAIADLPYDDNPDNEKPVLPFEVSNANSNS